jgi:hypothetical protein
MMKVIASICVLGMLSGCANITSAQVTTEIQDVQEIAQQVCSVVPTVASIEAIINASDPALATANLIASAICTAVGNSKQVAMKKNRKGLVTPKPVIVDGIAVYFE